MRLADNEYGALLLISLIAVETKRLFWSNKILCTVLIAAISVRKNTEFY